MAVIGTTIHYRPLRVALCLTHGDMSGLEKIVQVNTLLAGGMMNPIVPVRDDQTDSQLVQRLHDLNADMIYSFNDGIKNKYKSLLRDFYPTPFQIERELWSKSGKPYSEFNLLSVGPIIDFLWKEEVRTMRKKHSNCILPVWAKTDPLAMMMTVLCGSYDIDEQFEYDYKSCFLRGLKAKKVVIKKAVNLPGALVTGISPINFSAYKLSPNNRGTREGYGVFFGKAGSFDDLVSFWNIRASGCHCFFLPLEAMGRCQEIVTCISDNLFLEEDKDKHDFTRLPTIYYERNYEKDIKEKTPELFKDKKYTCRSYDMIYDATRQAYQYNRKPVQLNVEWKETMERYEVSGQLPFFEYFPQKQFASKYFAVDFHFLTEFEYKDHTLQLLDFADLNEWYARNVHWSYDSLRVLEEGFSYIINSNNDFVTLRPLRRDEYLEKLFERAGCKASISKPGKIAKQIIQQMRGDVDACRVFKITGVRNLLRKLHEDKEMAQKACCEIIKDRPEGTFVKFTNLYIESRKEPELTPEMAFQFLVKKKVVRAGISIKCDKCELVSWLPLNAVADTVQCNYCGNSFSPLKDNSGGVTWQYRKSGLFADSKSQEGAIPVILSLLQLTRIDHDLTIFTNHDIDCEGKPMEVDLIALKPKRDWHQGPYDIVIGECKSPGKRDIEETSSVSDAQKLKYQITEQDIKNMLSLKEVLDRKGFNTHLLFATTASKFSSDEIERFKTLIERHVPLILFTSYELEPYRSYARYAKEKIPQPHVVRLRDAAANSRFIYLGDSNRDDLLQPEDAPWI